jgi:hypothetical protein
LKIIPDSGCLPARVGGALIGRDRLVMARCPAGHQQIRLGAVVCRRAVSDSGSGFAHPPAGAGCHPVPAPTRCSCARSQDAPQELRACPGAAVRFMADLSGQLMRTPMSAKGSRDGCGEQGC